MNEIKLKPCPFCGRTDTLIIHEVSQRLDDTTIKQYTVICNTSGNNAGCGANCGYRHITKQDAITAWNKRAEKTGRWILDKTQFLPEYVCTNCKSRFPLVASEGKFYSTLCCENMNYCPNCGAKMEETENE